MSFGFGLNWIASDVSEVKSKIEKQNVKINTYLYRVGFLRYLFKN